jgi:hypothetical protein
VRDRWRASHPGVRIAVIAVVAIVVLEVGLRVFDAATRGADPSAPTSSSLSTARSGLAAYEELLARYGHRIGHQRGALADARLDPTATLVVLDPGDINRNDLANLRRFVLDGGRLVAGGNRPEWLLELAPADIPGWTPTGARTTTVAGADGAPSLTVETDGTGSWVMAGGRRALTFVPARQGGAAVFLADASPLHNALLAHADNAAFGLSLAGESERRVVFAEGVHGYGTTSGLAAIPFRWKVALIAVALAALLAMVAAGRRLGPPEDDARRLPPPRRVYVDAVAATLARTRRPADALAPLQQTIQAHVTRRAGLEPHASPAAVGDAARALGWPADEIEAMFVPLDADARILAAGRALLRAQGADTAAPAASHVAATSRNGR